MEVLNKANTKKFECLCLKITDIGLARTKKLTRGRCRPKWDKKPASLYNRYNPILSCKINCLIKRKEHNKAMCEHIYQQKSYSPCKIVII